jgi:hypothetical protein
MSTLKIKWTVASAFSPMAKTATWIAVAIVLGTIVRLNIERWAEDRGYDRIFTHKLPAWLMSVWEHLTGSFGLGFALGALVFAFWDPVARHISGPKKSDELTPFATQASDPLDRQKLEIVALKSKGELAAVEIHDRCNWGDLVVEAGGKSCSLLVTLDAPAIGRSVRVWSGDTTLSISLVRGVSQGQYIDVDALHPAGDNIIMSIGDRAVALTKDGRTIQLVLASVRDRSAGDAVDAVRFRYKVHDYGVHLLEAL